MIQAVIFDLDGVIVDTAKYHFLAWKRLADQLHLPFDESTNELLKGVSRRDSFAIILAQAETAMPEEAQEMWCNQKNKWYKEYLYTLTQNDILLGILELLQALQKSDIRVALGSASKNSPLILDQLGLSKYFDIVVDGNSVSTAKPNPEVFLVAAERLGVNPVECVVIEDAQSGVQAALAAGMQVIGIGDDKLLGAAHCVLPDTSKLQEALSDILFIATR